MSASDKKNLRKDQENTPLTERQKNAKKQDKELKKYTMTFAIAMILVAAIALTTILGNLYINSGIPQNNTIALTVGEHQLSNIDLNYYFVDSATTFYSDLYNSYGNYTTIYAALLYGLDLTAPLNTQVYDEESGQTWSEYFLQEAIESAEDIYTIYDLAQAEGYTMTEEEETDINLVLASLSRYASYYGYWSVDAYLQDTYGPGATLDSYANYYRTNTYVNSYYNAHADELEYSEEQISDYKSENPLCFFQYDYSYYYIRVSDFLEGGTEGENGTLTFTDEQRLAALEAAREAASSLTSAEDLLMFNTLISRLDINADDDDEEATEINGTVSTAIMEAYRDWVTDENRQVGDMDIFEYDGTVTPNTDEEEDDDTDNDEEDEEAEDEPLDPLDIDGFYVVLYEGMDRNEEIMINVRHILIEFEGGTTEDGETVYTEEEKQAAHDKAQELYEQWLNGETVDAESFAALVTDNSDDGGSTATGGLYENVYDGYMVEAFNDWCFNPDRQAGDHGLVETEFGWHIMYFDGFAEQTYRDFLVVETLRSEDMQTWYEELTEGGTSTLGDTSYLSLTMILSNT